MEGLCGVLFKADGSTFAIKKSFQEVEELVSAKIYILSIFYMY